jgi:geranylgeranyl diphosphate synthase type I
MNLKEYIESMLPAIETELQNQVARLNTERTAPFYEMLAYHLGWMGEGVGKEATGKRIRPLMVLLAAASYDANWRSALPAAAAVELAHNFSLVHDDVQDNSERRRGRLTVWKKWGAPMAINVGDALFVIAHQAILDLTKTHPAPTVVRAASILQDTCLDLTRGQFLDMSYEKRTDLTIEDYFPMVGGKTSALIAACMRIGALLGGASEAEQEAYRQFGYHLGLAFQIQDDILGVWGDESLTGKSAASDLVEGKKSLPALYGLGKQGKFAERWKQGSIAKNEVKSIAAQLENEGGKSYAEEAATQATEKALEYLRQANPRGAAGESMLVLANALLNRKQ